MGDVLRSASMLPAIVERHRSPYIAWLTRPESVELVRMMRHVDEVIELSEDATARVMAGRWDCVYSLSNDLTSAAIAKIASPDRPSVGFSLQEGVIAASNPAAQTWLEMAAFDRLKRANTKSYQAIMLEIIGASGAQIPAPSIEVDPALWSQVSQQLSALLGGRERPRVAINVGAGARWPKKMLSSTQICELIALLRRRIDPDILLVGGRAETERVDAIVASTRSDNRVYAQLTGDSIPAFVATLLEVDSLVCGDTLALHVATAIGLPTVTVFGPTSIAEIYDFDGLVTKLSTDGLDCLGCYGDCAKIDNCMSLLDLDRIVEETQSHLDRSERWAR
jgi:ADP-heptose:LPS heptosyltransferase